MNTVKSLEATIQLEGNTPAKAAGSKIDRFAPDPREMVEYTPEIADYILREIGKGRSLIAVCNQEGMPHHVSFLKWCYAQPDLAERYVTAKRLRAHGKAEEVSELTDSLDPQTTGKNEAYVTDIKARNLLRVAELGDPAAFSPKMQMMHQHSGSVVAITMDLSAPQSRQAIDITPSQEPETPKIQSPNSGIEVEKAEGGGPSVSESPSLK